MGTKVSTFGANNWSVNSKLEHKVPLHFSQKEQLVPLLFPLGTKGPFSIVPISLTVPFGVIGEQMFPIQFLAWYSKEHLVPIYWQSTAVGNALLPFGSNCSYSCPTGTELFLIKVLCSTYKWEQVPNLFITGQAFHFTQSVNRKRE